MNQPEVLCLIISRSFYNRLTRPAAAARHIRLLSYSQLLGGVVKVDDALWIEDSLGVPADEAHPEAMLSGAQLRPRGGGREMSADLHARREDGEAMMRELAMAGDPKARPIRGALLTSLIPGVERIDEYAKASHRVRTPTIMTEGNLAALPADVKAQHIQVAAA